MQELTYSVPGMHCGHCKEAVEREISRVEGVVAVEADLESKLVSVRGQGFSDEDLREAIGEAGNDAA
jgi:copper chaperone